jgi:hypothetical protein
LKIEVLAGSHANKGPVDQSHQTMTHHIDMYYNTCRYEVNWITIFQYFSRACVTLGKQGGRETEEKLGQNTLGGSH